MKRSNVSHDESIEQNLAGWCFEVGTEYEHYSTESAKRFLKYVGNEPVVDLGSGDGAATKVFVENGNATVAVDINPTKLERVNGAVKVLEDFVTYLQKPVDSIFMHHALEHYVNPEEVLELISKNLKPGCFCYIAVPMNDNPHSVHHVAFESVEEICPPGLRVIEAGELHKNWSEYYSITYKPHTMQDTPWATEVLEEGAALLKSLGVKWWVECGTLLGIYRENRLLPWDDPDLDISVELPVDTDRIKNKFTSAGFSVYAQGEHQIVFKKRGVLFDIALHEKQENKLVMDVKGAGKAVQDYHLFEKLGKIKFNGKYYPCPSPVEEYLEKRYGDWKTPKSEKRPWTEPGETLVWQKES